MRNIFITVLFFVCVYLIPLGSRPLAIPDEFRYSEIPREMIVNQDFISPRLLGLRYFEKPVFGYWLTAASFKIFGENNFALRLPVALCAGLTALLIALLVLQVLRDKRMAMVSALIYLSFGLVAGIGTFVVLDTQLTLFVTGCCTSMFLAILEPKFNRRRTALLLIAGAFAGLGFLTKGFVALAVPGLTAVGFLIWERRWKDFFILPWLPLLTFFAIIAPWAISIHRAEPDFWRYFVVVEHFQRFTSASSAQHEKEWWFFLPFIIVGALPSGLLLSPAIGCGKGVWKELLKQPLYKFAFLYLFLPLIFFSISDGKLVTYILPCFAPMAVLITGGIAAYFRSGGHHKSFDWVQNIWSWLLITASLSAGVFAGLWEHLPEKFVNELPLERHFFWMVMGVFLIYGITLWSSRHSIWKIRLTIFFAGIAIMPLCLSWFFRPIYKMPAQVFKQFQEELKFDSQKVRIVTTSTGMHAVAWVYKRSDINTFNTGELKYGHEDALKNGAHGLLVKDEELIEYLNQPEHEGLLILTSPRRVRKIYLVDNPPVQLKSAGWIATYYPPRRKEK